MTRTAISVIAATAVMLMVGTPGFAEMRAQPFTPEELHEQSTLVIKGRVREIATVAEFKVSFPTSASVDTVVKGRWAEKDIAFRYKHPGLYVIFEQEFNRPEVGQVGTFYIQERNDTLILIGYIRDAGQISLLKSGERGDGPNSDSLRFTMIEITETPLGQEAEAILKEYAQVPSRFRYSSILEAVVLNKGLGGIVLEERIVPEREKNYDEIEPPTQWAKNWDLSNWVMFQALVAGEPAGGCIVAHDTRGVMMLEGRSDLSVLWDIRVSPGRRNQGIGSRLFSHALLWSKSRGCKIMKVETQSNNLPACRFYAANGCQLQSITQVHYPEFPDEVQLIWSIDLRGSLRETCPRFLLHQR